MANTPESWAFQPLAGEHDFAVYDEAAGRDVALVRDCNEVHARLTAAAPAMFEALKEIAEYPLNVEGYNSVAAVRLRYVHLQVVARAALAKARGE